MTKKEMDTAAKAMAQTLADEIDADLTRVALAEIEAAQKHYPQPYAVWDEGSSSYTTFTTGMAVAGSWSGETYTITLKGDAAVAATSGGQILTINTVPATTAGTVGMCHYFDIRPTATGTAERTYDGLTALECFEMYEQSMRSDAGHSLTPTQLVIAKQEWTKQLRSKKTK